MDQHARIDFAQLMTAARPLLEAFPGDIWLVHEIVERSDGKLDKPPASGLGFRSNDPTTWCKLGEAIDTAQHYTPNDAGVGFAIVDGMITLDFDDCVEPDGTLRPEVAGLIEQLDSFTYTTVSGAGMRVVALNDTREPIASGKYSGRMPNDSKVEVFVGPCHFFNTFSPETNGKPVAARGEAIRALLGELAAGTGARTGSGAADSDLGEIGRTSDLGKRARNVDDLLSALAAIPHDAAIDRALWVKLGAAMYTGTGGTDRGRDAFLDWSETWYRHAEDPAGNTEAAELLWESFAAAPPRAVGAGTVFERALRHGWTWPKETPTAGGYAFERFVDVTIKPTRDFVEGLIETDSVVVAFGPPGSAKTFFVLDLLLHVAWGKRWFGRHIEPGPAVLFALESRHGVERRIAAFREYYHLHGVDLPFRFTAQSVDLSDNVAVDELIKAVRAQSRLLGRRIKIVAIDTLAAALGSKGDENSAEVMNPVLANCHRIREAVGGTCLILVHHAGKVSARGPRGFSGIAGAVSTLLEIQGTDNRKPRRVIVRKQRDLERSDDLFYRLRVVELGIDPKHGRPITSCVVAPILGKAELAAADAQTKAARLTPQQRLALDALQEALQRFGVKQQDGRVVTTDRAWRNVFRERFAPETPEHTIYKALQRARQVLFEVGLIEVRGNQVWLTRDLLDDEAANDDGEADGDED